MKSCCKASHQAPPTVTVVVVIVCGHDGYDNDGRDLGSRHFGAGWRTPPTKREQVLIEYERSGMTGVSP